MLRWGLAFYTLLAAGLMIAQTLSIYWAGTSSANLDANGVYLHDVYSREIVAAHFAAIALPIYGWLASAAIMFAGASVLRSDVAKTSARREPLDQLLRILRRLPANASVGDNDGAHAVRRERRRIRVCCWLFAGFCLVCLAAAVLYVLVDSPFGSRELEPVMGRLLLRLFPLAAFTAIVACAAFAYLNLKAEHALPSIQPLAAASKHPSASAHSAADIARLTAARVVLYLLAIALVIWGVLNQGMRDVLIKAINTCTECVGLG